MEQLKKLLLAFGMVLVAFVANAQNSVYIDQVGNNSNIDVTQSGTDNTLGNNTTKSVFYGDSQGVTISQIGNSNNSVINIQGVGITLSSQVQGNNNTVNATCGQTGGLCNNAAITASAVGDNNTINVTGSAKSIVGASITGSGNTANVSSITTNLNGSNATVTQTGGDANHVTVTQNGPAGLNGFQATVDITGGGNIVGVTQGGTIDSTVWVKSQGSNNNITVHSSN